MRLIETRNCRTGAKQQFIDGRRVSNHEFSETWLKVGAHGHGTIEQTRHGDRHTWESGQVSAAVEIIRAPMGGAWACPLTDEGSAALQSFFDEGPSELAPLGGRAGYIVEPFEITLLAEHLKDAGAIVELG